jgi:hypothetical protein
MSGQSAVYLFIAILYMAMPLEVVLGKAPKNIKLERAIRSYYWERYHKEYVIKYYPAYIDLNRDGKREAVVYIFGDCGLTACPLLIATPTKKGYRIISELRPVQTPIWVSNKRNRGWYNIVVIEGGTANDKPFRSAYRYDGKSYIEDSNDNGRSGKMIIKKNISPLNSIPLQIKHD